MPYAPVSFSCPHCRTPLRLREQPSGTMGVTCPECARPFELVSQAGEITVVVAGDAAPTTVPVTRPATALAATAGLAGTQKRWLAGATTGALNGLADPLIVTWLAAGIAAIALGTAFLMTSRASSNATVENRSQQPGQDPIVALAEDAPPADNDFESPPPPVIAPVVRGLSFIAGRDPVAALKPPASPPIDERELIRQQLIRRVLRFEQSPVSFELIRSQIEEMTDVPIGYGDSVEPDSRHREAPVSLSLADVSFAEILAEAAKQAGLQYVVEPTGVVLVPDTEHPERPTAGVP